MRLVLDTNVVASAMLWGGSPKLMLQARREKRVELYTSTPLLAELADILGRRKFEKKIAASLLTVEQLMDRYAELAQVVRPTPTPRIVSGLKTWILPQKHFTTDLFRPLADE